MDQFSVQKVILQKQNLETIKVVYLLFSLVTHLSMVHR